MFEATLWASKNKIIELEICSNSLPLIKNKVAQIFAYINKYMINKFKGADTYILGLFNSTTMLRS